MRFFKIEFINHYKVFGEFVRPKNMIMSLNNFRLVLKAAFHSSPSLIQILLYSQQISSLVKYLACLVLSISS